MIRNSAIFLLAILFISSIANALDAWENLEFPQEYQPITTIYLLGEDLFVGTEHSGIFVKKADSDEWQISLEDTDGQPVRFMVEGIYGTLFAVAGENRLYRTFDFGENWDMVEYFIEMDLNIGAIASNNDGELIVSAPHFLKSNLEGEGWKEFSESIEIGFVHALDVSSDGAIWASMQGQYSGVVMMEPGGDNWRLINDGLPENPEATQFIFSDDEVFATVYNRIYRLEREENRWYEYSPAFENIARADVSPEKDFAIAIDNNLAGKLRDTDEWVMDNENLVFDKPIRDLKFTPNNKICVAFEDAVVKSAVDLAGLFSEVKIQWKVKVVDINNSPVKQKEFQIAKIINGNIHHMGNLSTDSNGEFIITTPHFSPGDELKVERVVYTEKSAKAGHGDVDDIKYKIKIDNADFDSLGSQSFLKLTLGTPSLETKLKHTTIMYNLVFSIEWDAKQEYIYEFEDWIKNMSYFLYDVSDGQIMLNKVAIYDNKKEFKNCDVRVYASNTVWPCAHVGGIDTNGHTHVHLPRKWFGNGKDTRILTARNNWMTFASDYFYTTICHEFGHYGLSFYDEYVYVDTNKAKLLPKNYNYGFMDFQYPGGGPYASEMSTVLRYPTDLYKITAQWHWNGSDCWADLQNDFEKIYDGIPCPIVIPSERSNLGTKDYLPGPLESSLNNNIGFEFDSYIENNISSAGHVDIKCVDKNKNTLGETHVVLQKGNGRIYQGKSDTLGNFKVLGAEANDWIFMTYNNQTNFSSYIKKITVTSVHGIEKEGDRPLEALEIELDELEGSFLMANSLEYMADESIRLNFAVNEDFPNNISVELPGADGEIKNLDIEKEENIFRMALTDEIENSGMILINTRDNSENDFIIPLQYKLSPFSNIISSLDGGAEFFFGIPEMPIKKFVIASSSFNTFINGLPGNARRLSPVYSFHFTVGALSHELNSISLAYDAAGVDLSEKELKIYRMNEDLIWENIGGSADTSLNKIIAPITSQGLYAAFAVDKSTAVDENEENGSGLIITPNPAGTHALIKFQPDYHSNSEIAVYTINGREVFKGQIAPGAASYELNTSILPNGIFYVKISRGNNSAFDVLIIRR